jgi:hypothetical protein
MQSAAADLTKADALVLSGRTDRIKVLPATPSAATNREKASTLACTAATDPVKVCAGEWF